MQENSLPEHVDADFERPRQFRLRRPTSRSVCTRVFRAPVRVLRAPSTLPFSFRQRHLGRRPSSSPTLDPGEQTIEWIHRPGRYPVPVSPIRTRRFVRRRSSAAAARRHHVRHGRLPSCSGLPPARRTIAHVSALRTPFRLALPRAARQRWASRIRLRCRSRN